ncbi:hypothetical protein [Mesorhizobium sp.]|uniref:hypothetical protein n=1 Tax=Mesorhizobium sp. TaxID=1871066 RepID=UPI000FE53AF7|nr:hypothetical protein [Mesorhizobium sp.]RWE37418.1 MAG: hypothetical protein EOS77_02240 [Mesorhizobium sp.]
MSLEEALNRNNELLATHNALLEKVLGQAAANKGGKTEEAAAASGKGKGKDKPAETKSDEGAASFDNDKLQAAIKKAGGWLGEFKDNEKDPETDARRGKFREALDKLGFKTAKEINTQDACDRFDKWIDKQIAAGRITPAPEADSEETSDDDI